MPTMTAEQVDDYLTMSEASVNIADAKSRLSQLVNDLSADETVLLHVHNRPRAAIIDIGAYRDLLARAEAYEHMRLADEAETARTPYEEAWAEIDRHVESRRAARAQKQEAA